MINKRKSTINILGINISKLNKEEVLKKIEEFLADGRQHQIITPNPEFLLTARHDEEFFYVLNKADLAIPDGFGLKIAAWFMGRNLTRIAGADLTLDLLKIAERKNLKAAILNRKDGLSSARDIKRTLNKTYPRLKIEVEDIGREWSLFSPERLNRFRPDILFCTLGAPWQDKFIYHNLERIPSAKIGIGVGGSIDYLTGKAARAPYIMRLLGIEWLWRLIRQPKRWKRIYRAVIVFSWAFFRWRFILPFLYRPNVACILYRKSVPNASEAFGTLTGYETLLVQRSDQPNHWQLPQGGMEGQDLKTAGGRELSEEIGTDKFKVFACYRNLYKYIFKERLGQYNLIVKNIVGYKGQKQGLCIAEFTGRDSDIKINFWDHKGWKWVKAENLINEVHPIRREAAKIFLKKFKEAVKQNSNYDYFQ